MIMDKELLKVISDEIDIIDFKSDSTVPLNRLVYAFGGNRSVREGDSIVSVFNYVLLLFLFIKWR